MNIWRYANLLLHIPDVNQERKINTNFESCIQDFDAAVETDSPLRQIFHLHPSDFEISSVLILCQQSTFQPFQPTLRRTRLLWRAEDRFIYKAGNRNRMLLSLSSACLLFRRRLFLSAHQQTPSSPDPLYQTALRCLCCIGYLNVY